MVADSKYENGSRLHLSATTSPGSLQQLVSEFLAMLLRRTATQCVGSAEYEVVVAVNGQHHCKMCLSSGRPKERHHVKRKKRRENWQVDAHLKHRVLDTTLIVVNKTGHSTLTHYKNNPRVGRQSVDCSDVTVHLYQTIVKRVKYEWTRNNQACR